MYKTINWTCDSNKNKIYNGLNEYICVNLKYKNNKLQTENFFLTTFKIIIIIQINNLKPIYIYFTNISKF